MNGSYYSSRPTLHEQGTDHYSISSSRKYRAYSTDTVTDSGDDYDQRASGTVTRFSHISSYDAPIVLLSGALDQGETRVGATLYQPFGITGGERPQSVIGDRITYMNDSEYRGPTVGAYTEEAIRAKSALSFHPDDMRPQSPYESVYERPGYEGYGGYREYQPLYDPDPPRRYGKGWYRPGSALSGGYRPGSALSRAYRPGSALSGGYQPGSALTGGYRPGSVVTGGYRSGNALSRWYRPGSALTGGYGPGNALSGGYRPESVLSGGYRPGSPGPLYYGGPPQGRYSRYA